MKDVASEFDMLVGRLVVFLNTSILDSLFDGEIILTIMLSTYMQHKNNLYNHFKQINTVYLVKITMS